MTTTMKWCIIISTATLGYARFLQSVNKMATPDTCLACTHLGKIWNNDTCMDYSETLYNNTNSVSSPETCFNRNLSLGSTIRLGYAYPNTSTIDF